MVHNHDTPATKWELVNRLSQHHPENRAGYLRLPKNRLYAIWFRQWREAGCLACIEYSNRKGGQS